MDLSRILSSPPTGPVPGSSNPRRPPPYGFHRSSNFDFSPPGSTDYGSSSPFHRIDLDTQRRQRDRSNPTRAPTQPQRHTSQILSSPDTAESKDSDIEATYIGDQFAIDLDMSTSDEADSDTCAESSAPSTFRSTRRRAPAAPQRHHRPRSSHEQVDHGSAHRPKKRRRLSNQRRPATTDNRRQDIEEINLIDDEDPGIAMLLGKQLKDQVQSQAEASSSKPLKGTKLTRYNCSICMDGLTDATATTCGKSRGSLVDDLNMARY